MKLQISYNFDDLEHALEIAETTFNFADIIEVGSLLIFKEGINAIQVFKKNFPRKPLFANVKISENVQASVELVAGAGATMISILGGIPQNTVKKATEIAHKLDVKIVLDVFDMQTAGQVALDSKTLGIDAILLHQPPHPFDVTDFASHWQSVQANTELPLFITGNVDRSNINYIKNLKPACIAIGSGITKSDNPASEAQFFKSVVDGIYF